MLKTFRNIAVSLLWLFLPLSLLTSCSGEEYPDKRDKGYGYVQFKVYKEASYTGTKASIDYLGDVSKVMVMLRCGDLQISQTLTLGASSAESAEYGTGYVENPAPDPEAPCGKLRNHRLHPFRQTGQGNLQGRGVGLRRGAGRRPCRPRPARRCGCEGKGPFHLRQAFRFRSPGRNPGVHLR